MAKVLQELCYALIQSTYGELCAQLFSDLAGYGRLTIAQLVEKTQLRPRQVRHGITVLLENHIVQRLIPDERSAAVYQANYRAAYNIVRHDNIIQLVQERWGEDASVVVEAVIDAGHVRVGDVVDVSVLAASKREANSGINTNGTIKTNGNRGNVDGEEHMKSRWHQTIRKLLHAGVLVKASPRSYIPHHDLQEELEEVVISENFPDGKISGPKKKLEFNLAVLRLRRQWQTEDEYSDQRDLERSGPANKRVKLNGGIAARTAEYGHTGDENIRISPDLIIRVNHSRCIVAMRSQRLQKLAERYLGEATAAVYGAFLHALESKCHDTEHEASLRQESDPDDTITPSSVVTIPEIYDHLDSHIDISAAIRGFSGSSEAKASTSNQNGKRNRNGFEYNGNDGLKIEDGWNHDMEPNSNGLTEFQSRTNRCADIEVHLGMLEEHSKHFCRRHLTHGHSSRTWMVDFAHLNKVLVQAELDEVVLNRHGPTQLRIIRLLREKGKLDEKQIASMAMMFAKDVYTLLTRLQFEGILEGQEIPKDNSRQPNKSLYLWYIDDARVQDLLLQKTYKIMTRHLQRVYVERRQHRTILEKASRSDVKGREQEKLSGGEKQILRQLRENEERLLTQVSRLDELVSVFRDFSGTDISLRG